MAKMIFSTTGSLFIYGGTTYYLTNMTYTEKKSTIDTTDTGTAGDGKEYVYTRTERDFTVDIFATSGSADMTLGTLLPCTIKFEGKSYIGSASIDSRAIDGAIDTAVKLKIAGKFQGAVTAN